MRNNQIFVLLLVILLPMSGCLDGAVGDAEGTNDADGNEGTSTGDATNSQSKTWYSSGGVYQSYWDDGHYSGYYSVDGNVLFENGTPENGSHDDDDDYVYRSISSQSERCLDWGPYYDSSTGETLGERCNEWGYPESASDWNFTDCTDNDGEVIWDFAVESNPSYYRYAPNCKLAFATINSTVGEALLIYEWSGFSITSTCNGGNVYTSPSALSGKEYVIAPGTALECSHELYQTLQYTSNEDRFEDQSIWSIVYAIQDTTVV
jgi:hypothetical protein